MKTLICIALAFVAILMVVPEPGTPGLRNLPLLIVLLSLVALYFIVCLAKRVVLSWRVHRILRRAGMDVRAIRRAFRGARPTLAGSAASGSRAVRATTWSWIASRPA